MSLAAGGGGGNGDDADDDAAAAGGGDDANDDDDGAVVVEMSGVDVTRASFLAFTSSFHAYNAYKLSSSFRSTARLS